MNFRSKLVCSLALFGLLCLMLPGSLRADSFTYTYTGNSFGYNGSVYPLTGVSGSFTLASPLAPGTTTDPHGAFLSLSFTDGESVFDLANFVSAPAGYLFGPQNSFSVTTDAAGQIVAWDIILYSGLYPSGGYITTCNEGVACSYGVSQDGVNDWTLDYNADLGPGGVYGAYTQGTWTYSSVSTPEPSSLMLFAIGSLALVALASRKVTA